MGFLQPDLPVVDHETWHALPRLERMRPMARHFADHGFGSPDVLILLYLLKIVLYAAVGWGLVLSTPGIDGAFAFDEWGADPRVLVTFALWTMLFEVLGIEQDESTKPMFPNMPPHPYKKKREDFMKRLGRKA